MFWSRKMWAYLIPILASAVDMVMVQTQTYLVDMDKVTVNAQQTGNIDMDKVTVGAQRTGDPSW